MNLILKIMQRTNNANLSRPHGVPYTKQLYRNDHSIRKGLFESTSFVCPSNRQEKKSSRLESFRNSSTQTSKTVVALNVSDTPRMSPDSLSPKTEYNNPDFSCQDSNFSLDRPSYVPENRNMSYSRKSCLMKLLHTENNDEECDIFPDKSLTQAFLEKTHLKYGDLNPASVATTRSRFLQQTSPLRKLTAGPNLKSQSFIESSKFVPQFNPPTIRFKVKTVKEKQPTPNPVKPVKFFCEKELGLNLNSAKFSPKSQKNFSFMSPTFSSEQKNKMREIETVTKLISPTRRGRSASPKTNTERKSTAVKKVPYIDKSSSSIFRTGFMGDTYGMELNLKSPVTNMSSTTILDNCNAVSAEHDLFQAITKLRNCDWNTALRGLAEIVEICRISDTDFVYPHMTTVNQRIIELLKSPRSHVCRTTCQAVGHLFEYVKDTRRPEFDEIVDTLLCRTADSNKFIKHDANLALDCMVTHIPILHAVRAISTKGPEHKNSLVRTASARLVVCAVVLAGTYTVLNPSSNEYTRKRIILNMVRFLNDKTLETRKFGERLFRLLCMDKMFDLYLKRYLEKETIQKLKVCFKVNQKNGKT